MQIRRCVPFGHMAGVLFALALIVPACAAGGQRRAASQPGKPDSWKVLSARLRGVARTYAKWGITFDVKKGAEMAGEAGPVPSYLKVTGGYDAADTVRMDVEAGLGEKEAVAVVLSGSFKVGPDGKSLSGSGTLHVKGSGLGAKFKYSRADGLSLETGLEETFYSLGVKIGGDGKSPLSLGLKGGPLTIKIDPVKWVDRCRTVLPEAVDRAKAAAPKVGGVLIRTDTAFLAAALANAAPPEVLRRRDVTVVSLKRLLAAARSGSAGDLGPLTSVIGVAADSQSGDVLLIGRAEAGAPAIPVPVLSAVLRAVWRDGLQPFVSLNPSSDGTPLKLVPQVGGLPTGLEQSGLVATMLAADYRIKAVIYGDTPVAGITPVPAALSHAASLPAAISSRFWFAPRPMETGDVCALRLARGAIYTFDAEPMVMTETMSRSTDPEAGEVADPWDGILQRAAVELTERYPDMERTHPELQLKPLRQVFEIATAAAILRREPPASQCAGLLRQLAELPVPRADLPTAYTPLRKSVAFAGRSGGVTLWGGVGLDTDLRDAQFRMERSLGRLFDRIQSLAWRGCSARMDGAFDPVIADAELLSRAQMAQPHLVAAIQELKQRNLPQALADIDRVIALDPHAQQAYLLRAMTDYLRGRPSDMLADAERAVRNAPSDARAYYWRGFAYNELLHYPESFRDAGEAIRLDPTMVLAYGLRADDRRNLDDAKGAIADIDTALKFGVETSFLLMERGLSWVQAGDRAKAIADYSASIALNPRNKRSLFERAWLYKERGDFALAIADYARLAEIEPTSKRVADLAGSRVQARDYSGAVKDAERAIGLDASNGWAYMWRAGAYEGLRSYEKAIADYETAGRLMPDLRGVVQEKIDQCRKSLTVERRLREPDGR